MSKRVACVAFGLFVVACSDPVGRGAPDSGEAFDLSASVDAKADARPDDQADAGSDMETSDMAPLDLSDTFGPDASDMSPPDFARDTGADAGADAADAADVGVDAADLGPMEPPNPCDDPNPPQRCSEDPDTFEWPPAAVVNFLELQGAPNDPPCCFDYDGDGMVDNALGETLDSFGFLADFNLALSDSIASGEFVGIFEFDTITDLMNDTFVTSYYGGAWAPTTTGLSPSGNDVLVDPDNLAGGTQPLTSFAMSNVTAGAFDAQDGELLVGFPLLDLDDVQVPVVQARIVADVDQANSGLPTPGVALTSGKLGGVITVESVYDALNTAAESCTCLGLQSDPLIDTNTGQCSPNVNTTACGTMGQDTCQQLVDNCDLYSVMPLLADIDSDGDGQPDAISAGFEVTTYGATITGVVP